MPFNEGHQSPGNPIPSAGWNALVDEVKRLGTAKVDTTGGTLTGPVNLQQTLTVAGTTTVAAATVGGTLSVAGRASMTNGAGVNGSLDVAGMASVSGACSLGATRVGGAGTPADTLEVVGNVRVGGNPLRFTSAWSGFPDSVATQAEISNDTGSYKRLMIVGNKSRGDGVRRVGLWDHVNVGDVLNGPFRLEVFGPSCAQSFCNLSDGRLKTDVAPIDDALTRLTGIRGVTFRWAGRDSPPAEGTGVAGPAFGVLAQEVAEVFPSLVSTMGPDEHLAVDVSGLTAVLVEAVKQLKADNDQLRSRVAALEASAGE